MKLTSFVMRLFQAETESVRRIGEVVLKVFVRGFGVELLSEFFVRRRFVVIALAGLVVVVFPSCVLACSCLLLVIVFHFLVFIA